MTEAEAMLMLRLMCRGLGGILLMLPMLVWMFRGASEPKQGSLLVGVLLGLAGAALIARTCFLLRRESVGNVLWRVVLPLTILTAVGGTGMACWRAWQWDKRDQEAQEAKERHARRQAARKRLERAVNGICDGHGNPAAAPYGGRVPDSILVMEHHDYDSWRLSSETSWDAWQPASISATQLVACLKETCAIATTCTYWRASDHRNRELVLTRCDVAFSIREARSGAEVAKGTVPSDPPDSRILCEPQLSQDDYRWRVGESSHPAPESIARLLWRSVGLNASEGLRKLYPNP